MAIRVLGYKTVVEAKGTWPTNYIAKAQELKMLKDVDYNSYNDGAARGNVAVIVWNMLRTGMWDITSENETNGLTSGKTNSTMINKYFEDYTYTTVDFNSFSIDDDGKVMIKFAESPDLDYVKDNAKLEHDEYEYTENDFYTYVDGTEVDVLVNEDTKTVLMMVPTGADKVVEGTKTEMDDDKYVYADNKKGDFEDEEYDYVYAIVKGKKVQTDTQLSVESEYITDVKETSTGIKLNKTTYKDKDYEDVVVIKDDERITLKDVEEGDVLSTVTVNDDEDLVFYIVESTEVEGKLTKYVKEDSEITIGGTVYAIDDKAKYVEDPDDENSREDLFISGYDSAMRKEEVVATLDFLGRVVRIEFDGHIGENDETEAKFFAVTSRVSYDGEIYEVELTDSNGDTDTYAFAKDSDDAVEAYLRGGFVGRFVVAEFNDSDEIETMTVLAISDDDNAEDNGIYNPEEDGQEIDGYTFKTIEKARYNSDEKVIEKSDDATNTSGDVSTSSTIVVAVSYDEDEKTYTTEFHKGKEYLNTVEGTVLLITEDDDIIASYVVTIDNGMSAADKVASKVSENMVNDIAKEGEYVLVIDGEEYLFKMKEGVELPNEHTSIEDFLYGVIVYKTKTASAKSDYEYELELIDALTVDEIVEALSDAESKLVVKDSSTRVEFADGSDFRFGDNAKESQDKKYEDALFVFIDTSLDYSDDVTLDTEDEDVVSSVTTLTYSELKSSSISSGDVLLEVNDESDDEVEIVYVISGLRVVSPSSASAPTSSDVTDKLYNATIGLDEIQEEISIDSENGKITGTLLKTTSDNWGSNDAKWSAEELANGYFLVLDFTEAATEAEANEQKLFVGINSKTEISSSDAIVIFTVKKNETKPIKVYVGEDAENAELVLSYTLDLKYE